jgi:hypothetical protein
VAPRISTHFAEPVSAAARTVSFSGLTGDVGRTYAESTPQGPRWYWSVYRINLRSHIPAGVVLQGLADDLPAAKATFKVNWRNCSPPG